MKFSGEEHCEGKKVSAERVWEIYSRMLEQFQIFRAEDKLNPELRVEPTPRGWADYHPTPYFVIPELALETCEEWVAFYIAHEISHHAHGRTCHGPKMCLIEGALLYPFDIAIEYKGEEGCDNDQPWYPKRLVRASSGETICYEKGKNHP